MALPKRPSGGAASQNAAPPEIGKSENGSEIDEDFALPELDDLALPDLFSESYSEKDTEVSSNKISSIPKTSSNSTAVPDSSRYASRLTSSTNQETQEPAQTAVSDALDTYEDEDEETALNRELGLLDDDYSPSKTSDLSTSFEKSASIADLQGESESHDDSFAEIDENLEEDDSDDELADLLRGLEETVSEETNSQEDENDTTGSDETRIDDDWEAALAELESFNDDALPKPESDQSDSEDDDEEAEQEPDWDEEEFTPPSNPFALPEDFEDSNENTDDEESEDDSEEDAIPEDDFIPPNDPFANPFADKVGDDDEVQDESSDESLDEVVEPESNTLKNKISELLSPEKAKKNLASYFTRINAELHGEDAPQPSSRSSRNAEKESDNEEQYDDSQVPGGGGGGSGSGRGRLGVFGFLSPIRSLYTAIVNIVFGLITAILGILSKLPLIGFIFKIALEATRVLRAIAQYIPLAFFIAMLITVSYLSVPRDSLIALPDSGGSTFTEFTYDAASNSASGTITNTGDIIADVLPEFTVKTIQPELNPVSWVIPKTVTTCVADSVRVDIDSITKVTAKCSETITGFIPRVTGELK